MRFGKLGNTNCRHVLAIGCMCMVLGVAAKSPEALVSPAIAAETGSASGLALPKTNPLRGRDLFVSKACVVCHAVNGVGGSNGAPLDAETMDPSGNPFAFFAKMLAGMSPMLALQQQELGFEIELSAAELGDIVAFLHDAEAQKTLAEKDIPASIRQLME